MAEVYVTCRVVAVSGREARIEMQDPKTDAWLATSHRALIQRREVGPVSARNRARSRQRGDRNSAAHRQ